ncbi:tetrahydromethanopterin S-methyltransferase subunit E [Sphingopyxis panaciterrae]|uniref:DUF805 domain-containing protein n=1 Tax=Sphingopyxis panaciterrae TaxID=363841 RepID=UPI0014218BE2|nr:DUF805 domain-containing protein [Sphingopyxis panaciterrae]NIJ38648.1 tetrahydromethanopterin S-methyltransferase subunit E [Sphingopyxis panaciterrae]
MAPPDLSDRQQYVAYRRELRGVARWSRLAGFVLVLIAFALFVWPQSGGPSMLGPLPTGTWGWIALILGWIIWIAVIVRRTRYHKARLADEEAAR